MNKKVVTSVALMVVANLATVFYVNQQMLDMQKTVDEMKGLAIKLPPEFESQLKRNLSDVVEGVKCSATDAVASFGTNVSYIVAQMRQNVVDAREPANKVYTNLTPMVRSSIENSLGSITTDVNCAVTDMKKNVAATKMAANEACAKMTPMVQSSLENLLTSVTTDVNYVVADMKQNVMDAKESANEAYAKMIPMVQSSMESMRVSITTNVNCVVADMKQTVAAAKESAEKAFGETTRMMQSAIIVASSNLVEMCRLKVLGNELEADRSYQKALQVLKEGDFALAKLYCMNAINHSPTRKLYFEKLIEVSAKVGDETRDDLEQLKGALELGIFQVAADDVLGMRNMLAGVVEKLNKMDAVAQLSREEEEKAASDQALTSLREGDLCYDSVIGTNSEERLVLLQRRLVALRDLDKTGLSTNDVVWVEEQDACTRMSLQYFNLVNSVESYLLRAEKLIEEDPSKLGSVNVMVQTASQLLSQAFGIDTVYLPATARGELQMFAERIEKIETRFNKIKSEPAIAEIRSLIAKVEGVEVAAQYQEKIDFIEECLSKISRLQMVRVKKVSEVTKIICGDTPIVGRDT